MDLPEWFISSADTNAHVTFKLLKQEKWVEVGQNLSGHVLTCAVYYFSLTALFYNIVL